MDVIKRGGGDRRRGDGNTFSGFQGTPLWGRRNARLGEEMKRKRGEMYPGQISDGYRGYRFQGEERKRKKAERVSGQG